MQGHADSWYAASANPAPAHPGLEGEVRADVCVVGGGFTGLSAALHLAERGYNVVLLEAERIGWGATGRNGGQICTGFSNGMTAIEEKLGMEAARACWAVAEEAKALIRDRVERHNIDCSLKWGYLHVATKPSRMEGLKRDQESLARYGCEETRLLDGITLMERLKSPAYHGALWESAAGHFHPLNYALGLAGAAEAAGVQIFERSPVERVATGPRPAAYTAEGVVRAKHMVLAGNAYLGPVSRPLYRRIMPVASYVLATEPLGEDGALATMPGDDAVSDTNFIVNYFRLSEDKRMLFGGRASYTQIRPRDLFAYMRPRMAEIFPQLADARMDYCWEGNIGVTMDRMPDIGRLDGEVWYAQGYSGHGVALSGMYGKLIAEAIAGQAERFDLMARFRHPPFPGGKLRTPMLALAMMWYRLRDALS
jgi:gamma-glutamylputrescine oxidase